MSRPFRKRNTSVSPPDVYDPEEVRAVLDACSDSPTGHRDRLAVLVFWTSGIRMRELCSMTPQQLTRGCTSLILSDREVMIPKAHRAEMGRYLRVWLTDRKEIAGADSPLFCNLNGSRLDSSYFRRAFAQLAATAKVKQRFHPQGLRQTYAASLYMKDVPMEIIRRQLGLSDLGYTATWLKQLCPRESFRAMEDFALD